MWLIVGDVHWSEYSSIYRKRGTKFSKRLENLINTVNWIEETAETYNCERIIFLGDFFDRNELNANELTALQFVQWSDIPHDFLVGNHEGLMNDLSTSSAHLLSLIPNVRVIDSPLLDVGYGYRVLYLPYMLEQDRQPLRTYFNQLSAGYFTTQEVKQNIIFSHNDLKIQYGLIESKIGFDVDEIEKGCDLFINGHLHNGSKFCKNGYNIGNCSGQNFSENAAVYAHNIMLLEPRTLELQLIENPYALNFYKVEYSSIDQLYALIDSIKDNSIVSVKLPQEYVAEAKNILNTTDKVKDFRVVSTVKKVENAEEVEQLEMVNHLDEFVKFVRENIEVSNLVAEELSEVCKQ